MLAEREYKEYRAAFDAPSPKLKAQMFEDFLRKYPKSQYEIQTWPQLMTLYRNAGDNARATAAAYQVLSRDADDPDALLMVSQILLERRTEHAKAIANANHVLQTVPRRPKPENYTAADWERRKAHYIGTAHLQIGNAYVNQNNFAQADKFLRASLPFVKGIDGTEAAVVFYLGWANYQMEHYKEAASFFRQCVALAGGGPFGEQALRNLTALKTERRITE
jgi:tetratricopeptide (TPR) repeat protein